MIHKSIDLRQTVHKVAYLQSIDLIHTAAQQMLKQG